MPWLAAMFLVCLGVLFSWVPSVTAFSCSRNTTVCGNLRLVYPFGEEGKGCGDPDFQVHNCTSSTDPFIVINGENFYVRNATPVALNSDGLSRAFMELGIPADRTIPSSDDCFNFSSIASSIRTGKGTILSFDTTEESVVNSTRLAYVARCKISPGSSWKRLCGSWFINTPFQWTASDSCQMVLPRVNWTQAQLHSQGISILNRKGIVIEATFDQKRYFKCVDCWNEKGICGYNSDTDFLCSSANHNRVEKILLICLPAGGAAAVVGLTALLLMMVLKSKKSRRRRKDEKITKSNPPEENSRLPNLPVFSYDELRQATMFFAEANKIGSGTFGSVYRGTLGDRRQVAVKRLHRQDKDPMNEFVKEVKVFCQVQHPNIVRLYGCNDPRTENCHEFLLVFEFISNGTLADHLHGRRRTTVSGLAWNLRLKIALQTAEALAFLHAMEPPLLHRDVKPSNILLDLNMDAKVADFGVCRVMAAEATHVTTAPQGTPGYIDPRYYDAYELTDKSDVYSFGVVLLEIVSGRKAVDFTRNSNEVHLVSVAKSKLMCGDDNGSFALQDLVDAGLKQEIDADTSAKTAVMQVVLLARKCVSGDTKQRPSMKQVANFLQRLFNRREEEERDLQAWDLQETLSLPRLSFHRSESEPQSLSIAIADIDFESSS